jgi:hypothetical protein
MSAQEKRKRPIRWQVLAPVLGSLAALITAIAALLGVFKSDEPYRPPDPVDETAVVDSARPETPPADHADERPDIDSRPEQSKQELTQARKQAALEEFDRFKSAFYRKDTQGLMQLGEFPFMFMDSTFRDREFMRLFVQGFFDNPSWDVRGFIPSTIRSMTIKELRQSSRDSRTLRAIQLLNLNPDDIALAVDIIVTWQLILSSPSMTTRFRISGFTGKATSGPNWPGL